ncbi:hypothetical protein D3C76_951560 [compost metagenome]
MAEGGGEEIAPEQPAAKAGETGDRHPGAGHALVLQVHPLLHPGDATGDVLQHQRHGGDQAGDEAAPRQVVPAQEDEHRYQQGQGQQQARQGLQDQRVLGVGPVAALGVASGVGQVQAGQHGVDAHGGDGQDGDLAQGVEAAEVDQNHVHHVAAATAGKAVGEEEPGDAAIGAGQHRVGQQGHHHAHAAGQDEVAQATQAGAFARRAGRQVVERQDQQYQGHHLHHQLGQGQVRRGEAGEGQGHQQAGDAEDHQGNQALAMEDRGQHAGQRQHQQAEGGDAVQRGQRALAGDLRKRRQGQGYHQRGTAQQPGQVALQGAVLQTPGQPAGRGGNTLHLLLEDLLGVGVGQAGVPAEQRLA